MEQTPINKIRNFSIIAHIDHGKSTLADRFLELTHNDLRNEKIKERIMDRLDLEQEKGITIKLQAAKMDWKGYQLNLIDTPGHVDFSYEVSRSLAACDGAVLLIDALQGVQAQTISNAQKAKSLGLKLIPVINKIDIPGVKLNEIIKEITSLLKFNEDEIIKVSAKTGLNVTELLDAIVERIPTPVGDTEKPLKALIFDSFYHEHKGVVIAIRIFDGVLGKKNQLGNYVLEPLYILQKQETFIPVEIGIFNPDLRTIDSLKAGEVGYIATGLKEIKYFTVGDTISDKSDTSPLPGYNPPKPNVFATFFPTDPDHYEDLKIGLGKLALNDASLTYTEQKSSLLGAGFRCGFLGLLHMEIIQERLEREYDIDLIITAPTVEYQIVKRTGEEITIHTPNEYPDPTFLKETREPWVRIEVFTPQAYLGPIMDLCQKREANMLIHDTLVQKKIA